MPKCELCGNEYDKAFSVVMAGQTHVFDCFECAIHRLAPVCGHCGALIVARGVERNNVVYCNTHCSNMAGGGKLLEPA